MIVGRWNKWTTDIRIYDNLLQLKCLISAFEICNKKGLLAPSRYALSDDMSWSKITWNDAIRRCWSFEQHNNHRITNSDYSYSNICLFWHIIPKLASMSQMQKEAQVLVITLFVV